MSEKLVVHKFERGISFKTLHITTKYDSSETTFSDWYDGVADEKKKICENSHLVVKMVSGEDLTYIDLDSCAKEISNFGTNWNILTTKINAIEVFHTGEKTQSLNENIQYESVSPISQLHKHNKDRNNSNKINSICSLEYSLEKVKENNAQIMKNIHILNQTLNYTKKKEILDIIHPKSMGSYPCNTCGKHFVYETGLKRHYSMQHILSETQQRWQVVWTCTKCFQVWPHQELALDHSNICCRGDKTDCVREIKTSSLLQCEFCEKVFTSIPWLLRHSKTHNIINNYECNACRMGFLSYKSAEQHWLLCPWLKIYYKFALPKLLLCNACDRKFRNYEQLYNHRYKVGHFMMKILNTENNATTPILVYQCETCSQWFHSIAPLHAHRNHYHPHYDSAVSCKTIFK